MSRHNNTHRYDIHKQSDVIKRHVAIIGGGLVGSLAALYFARSGWKVILFELRSDPRKLENRSEIKQRSINLALSTRGISALEKAGLGLDKIKSHVIAMKGRMVHMRGGKTMGQTYGNFGECIYSVERMLLLELLLNCVESFADVEIYFQHQLKRCDFDTGLLEFENKAENKRVYYTADLIVGADGTYSTVRSQMMRITKMDYQQEYIPHTYCELTIPPIINSKGEIDFAMDPNHLHVWPRKSFMMIALPNNDKSFTCTLFMPNEKFDAIKTEDNLMNLFEQYFQDSIPLIGEKQLKEDFFNKTRGSMLSIKCKPYHFRNRAIILGDAAHSMVPFYGQGMNCGFQDVELLNSLFEKHHITSFRNDNQLDSVLEEYTKIRHPDATAICNLSMYNYIEMRHSVINPWYMIRRQVEGWLHWSFPTHFIPLYTMVSFSTMRYSEAIQRWRRQGIYLNAIGMATWVGVTILLFRSFAPMNIDTSKGTRLLSLFN